MPLAATHRGAAHPPPRAQGHPDRVRQTCICRSDWPSAGPTTVPLSFVANLRTERSERVPCPPLSRGRSWSAWSVRESRDLATQKQTAHVGISVRLPVRSRRLCCRLLYCARFECTRFTALVTTEPARSSPECLRMPESVPPNEAIVLGPDELIGLTGRTRRNAQARVLRCLSIEHKVRPDGRSSCFVRMPKPYCLVRSQGVT